MRCKKTLAATLLAFSLSGTVLACGYCIEDKIASVYDHAQVGVALTAHRQVAFVAVQGELSDPKQVRATIEEALRTTAGIVGDSLRLSVESGAAAFVVETGASLPAVVEALNGKLRAKGLQLGTMRVIDAPGQLKPPAASR